MPSTEKPPIIFKVYASSHGKECHHLPSELRKLFSLQKRFTLPIIDIVQGKRISQEVVERIKEDAERSVAEGDRQLILLILGSNNLRKGGDPQQVGLLFHQVTQHVVDLPGTHVVLTSPLPSPETDGLGSEERFEALATILNNISNMYDLKCSFLRTSKIFCPNGHLSIDKFKLVRGPNGDLVHDVHLNQAGAAEWAMHLYNHIRNRPQSAFSLMPTKK